MAQSKVKMNQMLEKTIETFIDARLEEIINRLELNSAAAQQIRDINQNIRGYKEIKVPRSQKKKKDPNSPKKPAGPYIRFCSEFRNEVKEANPDLKPTEVTKMLGAMWNELDDKEKAKYSEAYNKDLEEFNKKHNITPKKSTPKRAPKKKKEEKKEDDSEKDDSEKDSPSNQDDDTEDNSE